MSLLGASSWVEYYTCPLEEIILSINLNNLDKFDTTHLSDLSEYATSKWMLLYQNDNVNWNTAGRHILYEKSEPAGNNIYDQITKSS